MAGRVVAASGRFDFGLVLDNRAMAGR
jgi:hypothetical protein